jgi:hypothetical protein
MNVSVFQASMQKTMRNSPKTKIIIWTLVVVLFQIVFFYSQISIKKVFYSDLKEEAADFKTAIVSKDSNIPKETATFKPETVASIQNQSNYIFIDSTQNELYQIYLQNVKKLTKPDGLLKYQKYPRPARKPEPSKKFYSILEYTKVWGTYRFCNLKIDPKQLEQIGDVDFANSSLLYKDTSEPYDYLDSCAYNNCFFTCDQSRMSKVDAVLIYEQSIDVQLANFVTNLPRDPSQVWMLWNDEANMVYPVTDRFKFNWTITYNSQSSAGYCAYGCYTKLPQELNETAFELFAKNEFDDRDANVVWFVSNCNAKSRIAYAASLAEKYQLNVYGKCGDQVEKMAKSAKYLKIARDSCKRNSECETDVLKENKFYLSFENSNCR